jgi:hypothetical protein
MGHRTIDIPSHLNGRDILIQVNDVLHAPDLAYQILSESHATWKKVSVLKEGTTCIMCLGGRRSNATGHLYIVDCAHNTHVGKLVATSSDALNCSLISGIQTPLAPTLL